MYNVQNVLADTPTVQVPEVEVKKYPVTRVNFKSQPDSFERMQYYPDDRRSRKKKFDTNDLAKWLGIAVSAVIIAYFAPEAIKKIRADRLESKAKKLAEQSVKNTGTIPKGMKTDGVRSIGSYLKFENVKDDPLLVPISKAKTFGEEEKKMFMDMLSDSKIDEKYILAAGLKNKPFPNAAVLTGAPGVGKTLSVRMYAKEADAIFCPIKLTDFSNSYVNGTAGNMNVLFEDIDKLAKNNPNIEFVYLFDEMDGMCKKLENISADKNFLNENRQTFLKGLEGILKNKNVKCFGATNADINQIDEAVTSRMRRIIKLVKPDAKRHGEIGKYQLMDLPKEKFEAFYRDFETQIAEFDDKMARAGYSGRDSESIYSSAQAKFCRAMDKAKDESLPFDIKYLEEAFAEKSGSAAAA